MSIGSLAHMTILVSAAPIETCEDWCTVTTCQEKDLCKGCDFCLLLLRPALVRIEGQQRAHTLPFFTLKRIFHDCILLELRRRTLPLLMPCLAEQSCEMWCNDLWAPYPDCLAVLVVPLYLVSSTPSKSLHTPFTYTCIPPVSV